MIKKVKGAAGNKIYHVLDTVAVGDTQFTSVKVLAEDKPGKVVTLLPLSEGVQDVRKDSQVTSSSLSPHSFRNAHEPLTNLPSITVISAFAAYGFSYAGMEPDDNSRRTLSAFLQKVPELIKEGRLKNIPVKKFNGGLGKVVSDGFEYVGSGKVSAEKVAFPV